MDIDLSKYVEHFKGCNSVDLVCVHCYRKMLIEKIDNKTKQYLKDMTKDLIKSEGKDNNSIQVGSWIIKHNNEIIKLIKEK